MLSLWFYFPCLSFSCSIVYPNMWLRAERLSSRTLVFRFHPLRFFPRDDFPRPQSPHFCTARLDCLLPALIVPFSSVPIATVSFSRQGWVFLPGLSIRFVFSALLSACAFPSNHSFFPACRLSVAQLGPVTAPPPSPTAIFRASFFPFFLRFFLSGALLFWFPVDSLRWQQGAVHDLTPPPHLLTLAGPVRYYELLNVSCSPGSLVSGPLGLNSPTAVFPPNPSASFWCAPLSSLLDKCFVIVLTGFFDLVLRTCSSQSPPRSYFPAKPYSRFGSERSLSISGLS